jgi:uncharacterized SAM-binding protein YcdF (DUF218 family)
MRGNKTAKPAPRSDLAVDPKKSGARVEKAAAPSEKPKRRLFGLLKRKEKWVLSWRGRLVVWTAILMLGFVFILRVHPFLAVTDRLETQYLVIEGWIPNYGLQASMAEFKSRPYQMIFTVGADPLTGKNIDPDDSIALEAYKRLKWMGMNMDVVQAVPANIKYRNRTFQSALALRKWIEENHVPVTSFNLVTLGPHARRSRLLFEKAFAGKAQVGIIAVEHREYDPKRWWKYSEGVKEVIGEGVGYLYARFFFHPGSSDTN